MTRQPGLLQRIAFAALIVLIAVYCLFPVYWMFVTSVRATDRLFTGSLLPGPFGLTSFRNLFTLTNFPQYLWNSIVVSLGTTALTVLVAAPMAYALIRGRVWGARLMVRALLFAYMFPALLLVIPIDVVLVRAGLDNTLLSLILSYQSFTLPLAVWLLWSFFKTFPWAVEEAALVDGCTRWQSLFIVVLPISLPGVLTVSIFSFLLAWSDFVFPMIITSDDDKRTVLYGLTQISDTYNADWGVLMAGSSLAALPLLILLMWLGRFFIRGISEGAVK